jgi:hypothetical protein
MRLVRASLKSASSADSTEVDGQLRMMASSALDTWPGAVHPRSAGRRGVGRSPWAPRMVWFPLFDSFSSAPNMLRGKFCARHVRWSAENACRAACLEVPARPFDDRDDRLRRLAHDLTAKVCDLRRQAVPERELVALHRFHERVVACLVCAQRRGGRSEARAADTRPGPTGRTEHRLLNLEQQLVPLAPVASL